MVGKGVASPADTPEPCCRYLRMTNPDLTDRIILQGRALVRAIEALGTIQPSGPFERALARLRPTVAAAPSCVGGEILSASEAIRDKRPALWLTDN